MLVEPGRHSGQVYELTGPRALTFAEATELISRASGLPITYTQVSPTQYTAALVDQGLSQSDAHEVTKMFAMMELGVIAGTTEGVYNVLGRAPRAFEDYVVRTAVTGAWQR